MNYLVGDIGNTTIKLSILNKSFKIIKIYNLNTHKIFNNSLKKNFLDKFLKRNINKKVLISSVVPNVFKNIKKYLSKRKFKVYEIKDLKVKKILKMKIKNYNQLGSDRISNAIGSMNYKNTIIIDFGTATTFDIVKNGVYEGGVISPGV